MSQEEVVKEVEKRYEDMLKTADPQDWSYAWRTELNTGGFKAVDFLMNKVVKPGKCIGCAACVVICPVDVFDYENERPIDARDEACVYCELCVDVCPILRPPEADLGVLKYRQPVIDEGFGKYAYAVLSRSKIPEFQKRGQDGGVTTTLLTYALEKGIIKGAVVGHTPPDNPHLPVHKLATTREEILNSSMSRYTYSPNMVALLEAMRKNISKIAVVGVPCQIDGLRHLQYGGIELSIVKWYRENVAFSIGLFCSEAFTHNGIKALTDKLGVPPSDIENINIKGKVVLRMSDGREIEESLKDFRKYARPACEYCLDYSAELADIATGGIGLNGWAFTVIRTEAGHKLFQAALDEEWVETRPLEDAPKSKALLIKLSTKKRSRQLPALMPSVDELFKQEPPEKRSH